MPASVIGKTITFLHGGKTMLVLSRNVEQKIIIGKDIEVTVLEIRGNTVRLGITAPRDISIHREEVQQRIDKTARMALAP